MSTLSYQILVSNAILQGKKPGLQEGTAESGKENPQDDDAGTFTSSHLPQTHCSSLPMRRYPGWGPATGEGVKNKLRRYESVLVLFINNALISAH